MVCRGVESVSEGRWLWERRAVIMSGCVKWTRSKWEARGFLIVEWWVVGFFVFFFLSWNLAGVSRTLGLYIGLG